MSKPSILLFIWVPGENAGKMQDGTLLEDIEKSAKEKNYKYCFIVIDNVKTGHVGLGGSCDTVKGIIELIEGKHLKYDVECSNEILAEVMKVWREFDEPTIEGIDDL